MQQQFGEAWQFRHVADFLVMASSFQPRCPAVATWRFQVFWQLVQVIDDHVLGGRLAGSAVGLPVLTGASRCRRMTKLWLTSSELGVDRSKSGGPVLAERLARDKSAIRREGVQASRYHTAVASAMSGATLVAIAMDCSDCSGTELLTVAASLPLEQTAMWSPPQDVCQNASR